MGHQGVINGQSRGNQGAIHISNGHQWSPSAISGHQWASVGISGHQRPSVAISGHQRRSHLDHKRAVADRARAAQAPATLLASIEGFEPAVVHPIKTGGQLLMGGVPDEGGNQADLM